VIPDSVVRQVDEKVKVLMFNTDPVWSVHVPKDATLCTGCVMKEAKTRDGATEDASGGRVIATARTKVKGTPRNEGFVEDEHLKNFTWLAPTPEERPFLKEEEMVWTDCRRE